MSFFCCILFAALSIFDYPQRQPAHEQARAEFLSAIKSSDPFKMRLACLKGTKLFPEDPIWRYNLACSYSRSGKADAALESLEKAIRLGYRNTEAIEKDPDFKYLVKSEKFAELLRLAESLKYSPILFGPRAGRDAYGKVGQKMVITEGNLSWDFDNACFDVSLVLDSESRAGNKCDLYINRDRDHSVLAHKDYPDVTPIAFELAMQNRGIDLDFPNMLFPYPVFGNCSRALVIGPNWRSIPRALMTSESHRLKTMCHLYRSNQIWVFPAVYDCPPAGTNGDVFASVAPYWIATEGKSWSDQYYLRAALEVSRLLKEEVKEHVVDAGLLAPTIQSIIRKSLLSVVNEGDYLTAKAHPTAFPAKGLDLNRLKDLALSMELDTVPPAAAISSIVPIGSDKDNSAYKELLYHTPFATSFILSGDEKIRTYTIEAGGAEEYAFAAVHGADGAARIERLSPAKARITIDASRISQTNRVDIAIFGKTKKSQWGAPAFISFAVVDYTAKYYDPFLKALIERRKGDK